MVVVQVVTFVKPLKNSISWYDFSDRHELLIRSYHQSPCSPVRGSFPRLSEKSEGNHIKIVYFSWISWMLSALGSSA